MDTYCIFAEDRLIIHYFKGYLNINVALKSKSKVMADKNYDPNYNSIIDLRDASIEFSQDEMKRYIGFLKEQNDIFLKRKTALLVNEPNETAFATLYSMLTKQLGVRYKVVSTLEGALNWIDTEEKAKQHVVYFLKTMK